MLFKNNRSWKMDFLKPRLFESSVDEYFPHNEDCSFSL